MKGFVSFDPNDTIFTQNIHEGTGSENSYIGPKSVQNLLKYQCKCGQLHLKRWAKLLKRARFSVEFSSTSVIFMDKLI